MSNNETTRLIAEADYLNRINLHSDKFSAIERKISDYLLSNRGKNIEMPITSFAQEVGVSVSSVIRYCKLLGYSGFSELKFCIQQENYSIVANDLSIHAKDDIEEVKRKTAQFAHISIERTMQQVDDQELLRAAAAIKQAKNIYFCGVGSASGVARLAANQFMVLGIRAVAQSDILLNLRGASYLKPDEVMVVINYDGYSKMSSDAIMLAKEAGAATILITSASDALAHRYADIVLKIAARNDTNALNDVLLTISYNGYSKNCADAAMLAKEAGATTILITSCKDSLTGAYSDIILYTPARNADNVLNISTTDICQLAILQTLQIGVWMRNQPQSKKKSARMFQLTELQNYDAKQKSVCVSRVKQD